MAVRQSVKSQLHVGKQPTKNQAVNRSAEDLALPNSKKRCKGHDMEKKDSKESTSLSPLNAWDGH